MKRNLSVLSIIFAVIFILSTAAPAAALGADKYEARQVTAYLYNMDDTTTLTLYFDRDLPEVPYINVDDYFSLTRTAEYKTEQTGDGIYYVPGTYGDMLIDTKSDTVTINGYEFFVIEYLYSAETTGDVFEYQSLYSMEYTGENPLFLDLGAYGIDIIEKNGGVYFPVSILNDIFILAYISAEYIDGNLYFDATYSLREKSYFDRSPLYNSLERSARLTEFTYSELCFQIDNFYGRPAKSEASEVIADTGFDKMLDVLSDDTRLAKQLLLSPSLVDFYLGLYILSKTFNDGGHSVLFAGIENDLIPYYKDTALYKIWTENYGKSTEEKWVKAHEAATYLIACIKDPSDNIKKTKKEYLEKYEPSLEWENCALYLCGDTAVFSFDEFRDSVLLPYKQSLDYAKERGIKYFVIDLSANGGGATPVIAYITGIIFNSMHPGSAAYSNDYYVNTGNTLTCYFWVDLNLDGEINVFEFDVVYDFKFAFLTTGRTFSSANECAIRVKENGIMIIGETSGGGSCTVSQFIIPGAGYYTMSSASKGISLNGDDNDCGAEADVDLRKPYSKEFDAERYGTDDPAELGFYDYDAFYDFESFGAMIEEFYDRGDVNGDGVKNNKDVTELFKYVSESRVFKAEYDINVDAYVNNRDVYQLFKKVNIA